MRVSSTRRALNVATEEARQRAEEAQPPNEHDLERRLLVLDGRLTDAGTPLRRVDCVEDNLDLHGSRLPWWAASNIGRMPYIRRSTDVSVRVRRHAPRRANRTREAV